MYALVMTTQQKFHTIMSPEADAALDALGEHDREVALTFVAETLPNVTRRTAVSKATTPFGTIFTFRAGTVIFTCLNGHNHDGERLMIVAGIGSIA